jgi:uncharacterized protein
MIYLAFVLATLIIVLFVFYQLQYFMIFTPTYIKERRLCEECEALEIVTGDGIALEGVVYEPKDSTTTLFFFGGRSHDSVALIQRLQTAYPKTRVITFNYRSYGTNKGKITEQNMFADALHVAQIVKKNYGEFYLLGFSIGSSLSAYVASKIEIKALFLVSAFDSIVAIAEKKFGYTIPEFLVRYKFPTLKFLKSVQTPTYLFVSSDDEITYIENSRVLSQGINNLVLYKEYENRTHKEVLWDENVISTINGVLNR